MANVPAQAWCSTCGRPQPAGTPLGTTYCAWCSRRAVMLPYQPEMLTSPDRSASDGERNRWIIVLSLIVWALFSLVRISDAPNCDSAQGAVANLHPVFYPVMQAAVGQMQEICSGISPSWYLSEMSGKRPVDVTWQYQGATYDALYYVDSLGTVTAGNAMAVELDKAASSAGAGLGMLLH